MVTGVLVMVVGAFGCACNGLVFPAVVNVDSTYHKSSC